jgi:hypothetical protein
MWQQFFADWHFMRIIRLVLSMAIIYEAWDTHTPLFALMGVPFLLQAVFNVGCNGAACGVPIEKSDSGNKTEDITFTEIK